MRTAWRIARKAFQALDGEGARLYGGRWNSEGVPVVYASTSLALAALEFLVHVDPEDAPDDLVAMRIDMPSGLSEERLDPSVLPADWYKVPDHPACTGYGDAWAREGRSFLLRVPSALIPEEENVLINPRHEEAARVMIGRVRTFAFDSRLLDGGPTGLP